MPEGPALYAVSRCARCQQFKANNNVLCMLCVSKDTRRSHKLDGHTQCRPEDCTACQAERKIGL